MVVLIEKGRERFEVEEVGGGFGRFFRFRCWVIRVLV